MLWFYIFVYWNSNLCTNCAALSPEIKSSSSQLMYSTAFQDYLCKQSNILDLKPTCTTNPSSNLFLICACQVFVCWLLLKQRLGIQWHGKPSHQLFQGSSRICEACKGKCYVLCTSLILGWVWYIKQSFSFMWGEKLKQASDFLITDKYFCFYK